MHSNLLRLRRHRRVRKRIKGTPERPRLSIFRSSRHIYAQLVDDTLGQTLCAASTLEPALRGSLKGTGDVDAARKVGELIGERARERGVARIVFDRGGYAYHGRVAAVAEGARSAGLEF